MQTRELTVRMNAKEDSKIEVEEQRYINTERQAKYLTTVDVGGPSSRALYKQYLVRQVDQRSRAGAFLSGGSNEAAARSSRLGH